MVTIVVKDEIIISKDPAIIWNLVTDISRWSRLNRLIKRAAVYGPLRPGTEFKFLSGKWDFDGVIIEALENHRFVFDVRSVGLRLHFVWEIEKQNDGAKVSGEIAASGWMIMLFRRMATRILEDNLFKWLYALKTTLERSGKTDITEKRGMTAPPRRHTGFGPFDFLFKHNSEK